MCRVESRIMFIFQTKHHTILIAVEVPFLKRKKEYKWILQVPSCIFLLIINNKFRYAHQSWPQSQQALKHASLQQHCWGRIPDEPPALHNTTIGPSQTVIFCYTLCLHFQRGKHLFLHTLQDNRGFEYCD